MENNPPMIQVHRCFDKRIQRNFDLVGEDTKMMQHDKADFILKSTFSDSYESRF